MCKLDNYERDIEAERLAMMRADNHSVRLIHWQNMKNLEAIRCSKIRYKRVRSFDSAAWKADTLGASHSRSGPI